jgi:hypothetical protein
MGGGNGPLPFPDAIAQFSVETAALGAQDGNQADGLVNIVTRSGTNTTDLRSSSSGTTLSIRAVSFPLRKIRCTRISMAVPLVDQSFATSFLLLLHFSTLTQALGSRLSKNHFSECEHVFPRTYRTRGISNAARMSKPC